MKDRLIIRGARQNNLRGIDLDIPRRALTVITGVSGSGKSSLAFDTIYAEGQRRYVESLSTYAKQFLERMPKPDCDILEGISPTVAIEQKNPVKTARSTVGTATEVYDFLRLLYARIGRTVCPGCGEEIHPDTVQSVTDRLASLPAGTRLLVLFPLRLSERISREALCEALLAEGFVRILWKGEVLSLEERPALGLRGIEEILVVVDRLEVGEGVRARLADSLGIAFAEGEGEALVQVVGGEPLRFSERFRCARCDREFPKPTPLLFSFNSPYGACPECRGFGNRLEYDPERVVPNPELSLEDGAIDPWTRPLYEWRWQRLLGWARKQGIPTDVPWRRLRAEHRRLILEGGKGFWGVLPFFRGKERKRYKKHVRFFLRSYQSQVECRACGGSRLRSETHNVRVGGRTIAGVSALTVGEILEVVEQLTLTPFEQAVAGEILREIRSRLEFLVAVGVEYLALSRLTRTLSGGEAQRIALASALGSRLVDSLYVLDEPTIGLHPRDTHRLIAILQELRDQGNTVLVVEHDRDVIAQADHVVELGPGAGAEGGRVVFSGSLREMMDQGTLTGQYLSGAAAIPLPKGRRRPGREALVLKGARCHNIRGITVRIPLGCLVAVTGVSGSGKSTLVHDILYTALQERLALGREGGNEPVTLQGAEHLLGVILVDQSPIGRTPRSNPVTYLKAFDPIRAVFARTLEARRRRYRPGRFSFNIAGGRCEECKGEGFQKVEMHFLADLYLPCEECRGTRYKAETLEVRYRGKSIHDVLQMTVDEAIVFFEGEEKIGEALWHLQAVGLGYLRLGQPATTLSGGEAQRLKIARELARTPTRARGKGVLYLLDEPTTGLHLHDIRRLLEVLGRLVERGNTVLVIEHNLEVIKTADWVIDLGPEGGDGGGRVVAEGPPEAIAAISESHTGRYLQGVLVDRARETLFGIGGGPPGGEAP